jgi:hypothetical protein
MSGKKGRSGRKPKGYMEKHYNLIGLAEAACYEALNPNLPLSERIKVALPITIKNQVIKTEVSLLPAQDKLLLERYTSNAIQDNPLALITGNTATEHSIDVTPSAMQGNTQQGIGQGIEHDKP